MKPARSAAAGLGLLAALTAGCVLDAPYEKFAIVYGISDYEGTLNDLKYADDDAADMAAMLAGQGYAVRLRTDSEADRTNLLDDVSFVASSGKEKDLFLFFFSGHGDKSGSGPEGAGGDSQDEWIYLYGSIPAAGDPIYSETFNDDQLLSAFAAIPCRRKVLILDSCNSGGFIGNELEADGTPPSLSEGGESLPATLADAICLYANFDGGSADIPPWKALVISASGEREYAYESPKDPEDPPYNHGVFTYFLLQAERRADRNGDGYVTVTEAYYYVRAKIETEWNLRNGYAADAFSPHVSGGPVDYVLFRAR